VEVGEEEDEDEPVELLVDEVELVSCPDVAPVDEEEVEVEVEVEEEELARMRVMWSSTEELAKGSRGVGLWVSKRLVPQKVTALAEEKLLAPDAFKVAVCQPSLEDSTTTELLEASPFCAM